MSFYIDDKPSLSEIAGAINYLLANFSQVKAVNPNSGQITTSSFGVTGYLYKYLNVKYADSFDGSVNFSDSPTNRLYYGLRNNDSSVESTLYSDYVWTPVTGGFGTTKFFYYATSGGRQIQTTVATTAPAYGWSVDTGAAIDLDLVTFVFQGVNTFSAGTTGFTPSTPTKGDVVLAGTLNVTNGGTGVTTSTGTGSVVLSTNPSLTTPTQVTYENWTPISSPTYAEGKVWYDSTQKSLAYFNDVTNNVLHVGQENQLKVYNNTGSTIARGAPVYITSTSSGFSYPLVALAKADTQITGNAIGLANQSIPNATAGYITISGLVNGLSLGAMTVGDTVYVSPYSAGQLMTTYPPTGYPVKIGVVAYANTPNGAIYVSQSNAYVLAGGVVGTLAIANGGTNGTAAPTAYGVAYGTGTAYAFTSAGTAKQALLANTGSAPTWSTLTTGSSILYGDGSGGFSNVTIGTGVSFAGGILSATGAGGTVTSVTGTAPVVSSGGTTPAISLAAAYGDTLNPYASKTANYVLAAPNGSSGVPTFRALVAADIPTLSYVTSVSGTTGRITSTGGTTPVIDLTSGIATAGTTGSATLIPVVTIDTYGRVTSITTAANPQGTVTSVTGTAPVVSSGGATPAISMAAANGTTNGYLTSTDWTTFNGKGSGSVTSVSATVPAFLSITGSPITTSGTLAISYSGTALPVANGGTGLTAGTSGGVLYYSATGTLASSALLTQYGVVYGGGAGAAPVSTAAGTTGQVLTATTSGAPTWANPATNGTVTSVSFTGGIITVATATTTPALTVAGTSGGIPYFSSATTWATSATLAANAIVLGGGAGVAPATTTTGTGVVTALGVNTGTAGAFVVNGGVLGTPSSGTVTNLTGTASININGTVGSTTANTGAFTTLSASSTVSGTGFSTYLASPPAIGGTAAAAGSFTALAYSTTLTGGTGIVNFGSGQFYKDASGLVGIGTTSPSVKLDVYGSDNNNLIKSSNSGTNAASIRIQSNDAGNYLLAAGANNPLYIDNSSTAAQSIIFRNTSSSTERMRIDSSGNLGIGTSSPGNKLEVYGADNANKIVSKNSGTGVTSLTMQANDVGAYFVTSSANCVMYIDNQSTNPQSIIFRNTSSATERMRIDGSGNVGIGATANASAILDAQSTTKGVRMPNMTTTQKNAISSPAAGLMVFDTTLAKLCVYSGSAWQTITSI